MSVPPSPPAPDKFQEVIAAARSGSAQALEELFDVHSLALLSYARKSVPERLTSPQTASDFVQETLSAAYSNFSAFQGQTAGSFQAWLRKILQNTLCDYLRALGGQQRPFARRSARPAPASREPSPCDALIRRELHSMLRECIEELPEVDRALIGMRLHERRTYPQAGSALGLSEDAARQRYLRAMAQLTRSARARGIDPSWYLQSVTGPRG
jgi:RNA polymerase sigma-70 factor (ECF subfamily)